MTWREDLRRVRLPDGRILVGGSFRGVAFFVDNAESTGGRRAVVHEFPGRDDPFAEDLGRRARSFRIDAYVIGDDYLTQRDALLSALEDESGPGELVHPYRGVLRAICMSVSVRESKSEGGMATFALEFNETPLQAPVPVEVVDGAAQVGISADAAVIAMDAELAEQYDTAGLPAFALDSAAAALTTASESIAAKLGPIITATQELAEFTGRIELLTAQASSLVRQPASVMNGFRTAITGLKSTIGASPGAVMNALVAAYGDDLGPVVDAITATRARELANQTALTAALRRVLAIEAARLAPLVPYASIREATAARDVVAALLEEQASAADDTSYPAIVDLRSQVLRAVPGSSAFARVVTVTRNVPVPSLLLAYQLYGSVVLEQDLVARNGIRHPGFVVGDLKALSDG